MSFCLETIPDFHEDNCYNCYPPEGMDNAAFYNQTEVCLRIDKGDISEPPPNSTYKSFVYLDFDAKRYYTVPYCTILDYLLRLASCLGSGLSRRAVFSSSPSSLFYVTGHVPIELLLFGHS